MFDREVLRKRIFWTRIDRWLSKYLLRLVLVPSVLGFCAFGIGLLNEKHSTAYFGAALLFIALALNSFKKSKLRKQISELSLSQNERVYGSAGLAYYFFIEENFLSRYLGFFGFSGLNQYVRVLNFVLFCGPIYLKFSKQVQVLRGPDSNQRSLEGISRITKKFSFSGKSTYFNKLRLVVCEDASLDEFQCKWLFELQPNGISHYNGCSSPIIHYQNSSILARLRGFPKNVELRLKVSKQTFKMMSYQAERGNVVGLVLNSDTKVKYFKNFNTIDSRSYRIDWSLDSEGFNVLSPSWVDAEIQEIAAPADAIMLRKLGAQMTFEKYYR